MCFAYDGPLSVAEIKALAVAHLRQESAAAADPGLAIVHLPQLDDAEALLTFGKAAKQQVLTKTDAYQLAQQLNIDLSEHGGTGQGLLVRWLGWVCGCLVMMGGLKVSYSWDKLKYHGRLRWEISCNKASWKAC
ncbi:hypothetical protein [Shewanella dokdonensis]|uniref:hypothetical protein n=1 Tax=Shewanella dokdonensis TaxID=712036 RepID=UPI0031409E94